MRGRPPKYLERFMHHPQAKKHAPVVGGIIAGALVIIALFFSGPLFVSPEARFTQVAKEKQFTSFSVEFEGTRYVDIASGLPPLTLFMRDLIASLGGGSVTDAQILELVTRGSVVFKTARGDLSCTLTGQGNEAVVACSAQWISDESGFFDDR